MGSGVQTQRAHQVSTTDGAVADRKRRCAQDIQINTFPMPLVEALKKFYFPVPLSFCSISITNLHAASRSWAAIENQKKHAELA